MKLKLLLLVSALFFSLNVYSQVPDSPVLSEPPDLDIVVPLTPLLDWTDVSNTNGYILELSASPTFSSLVAPLPALITVSQYQVPAGLLLPNTVYYWRVKAVNMFGSSAFSPTWSFRTAGTPFQEIGHLSDVVNGLVSGGQLNWNQGNILINRLESVYHQLELGHPFVAKLHLMLFKLRVMILRYSHLLSESNADKLIYNTNKIIALISGDNSGLTEEIAVENKFELKQNYPNPFNPTTNIEYTVQERNNVILKVYDILGKEVATLVNAVQEPGSYIVMWDAANYGSGVYFYKLISGSFVETKRMVLKK